jgi:DNA-binding LacI/PurR family transcriptional regulator
MADVAQLADVSVGTVSNVITNARRVNPQTRRRVEVAIAQLDYRRDRIAESLSRRRTNLIGALVPEVTNPFFAELVQEIENVVFAAGEYSVVFATSHEGSDSQRRYIESFRERRVDGVIIVVAADTDAADIDAVAAETPVVLVDRALKGWSGDAVLSANEVGVGLAVDHLGQLGHVRIALINGELKLPTARERRHGFEQAMRARGLSAVGISQGSFTLESGYAQMEALLALPEPPTAVVAANDLLAMAAITAATARGLRVPRDVSVVGYDDITYSRLVSPPLTTVRQPARDMAREAASLLLDRLSNAPRESRRVVFQPELIVRRSTGPVQGRTPKAQR